MRGASGGLPAVRGGEPRRLAAFVHADMVGYSLLIGQDDVGTYSRLAQLRHSLIEPALERYGGKIHNTAGDLLMMEFSSVSSAVRFAVEIQTRIPEFDNGQPLERRIRFRMGINIGDAIPDGQNIHGDSVNIAARLQAICPPGCVCVSAVVRNHVQGLDLRFEPMGTVQLKNIAQPVEAFVVRLDGRVRSRRRSAMTVACVLLGLIVAGIGGWLWYPRDTRPTVDASTDTLSIAVLPFINLSGDHDEDYLADGISEDLTTDLSHLDGALVVARESAFSYRGKQVDIRDVGRQLGVRFVLEGSVRKLGDAVRINAQLIAAYNGVHVWADRFDQPLRDLRNGQDSTVQRIGTALNIRFDKTKRQPAMAEPAAYDLVLRARAILQEPRSEDGNNIALGYFEQALRKDPESVAAKAGVAAMLLQSNRSINRAATLVDRAEWVAPNAPDVLGAKFWLLMRQQRYEQAVATFSHLLDIDSSSAGVAAEFVQCIRCWGNVNNAIPLLERTARLNPLSANRDVIYVTLGRMLIMVARDADAIDWLQKVLDLVAHMPPSQLAKRNDNEVENTKLYLAAAYALSGRLDDAHTILASAMSSPRMSDFTIRWFITRIPVYYSADQRAQEMRLAEGFRLAGAPDHLDESADYHIASTATLYEKMNSPTPMTVPGGTTVTTEELVRLLETKPLVLTTTPQNPTVPGAIRIDFPETGTFTDEWQTALDTVVAQATHGDKQHPIVTFAWCVQRWQSRNLALRLIALGYTHVYWYRGGWEAWDSHNLPKAPLTSQFIAVSHGD